jgi:SAM-dependent methyltransferase
VLTRPNTSTPTDRRSHWDRLYSTRSAEELSWFQKHPALSVELIEDSGAERSAKVIDIGGGDSLLVDALLGLGYVDLTVLDVSPVALARAQQRLGEHARSVRWVGRDVTQLEPVGEYDLWHDRAVFHFMTAEADRISYIEAMNRAIRPGGHAVIATFSLEGPEKCSGLGVRRYSVETLAMEIGPPFRLVDGRKQVHRTPAGTDQSFAYGRFVKT